MTIVYLSLGSNLGDRERHLQQTVECLDSAGLQVLRISSVFETDPVDKLDQPRFLNAVVEVRTTLLPRQLLARTSKLERRLGRKRLVDKGPRTIDIDILLYGAAIVNTRDLTLPHPRMTERRFVLEPLAELAPGLRHPVTRRTIAELLASTMSQGCRRTSIQLRLHQAGMP